MQLFSRKKELSRSFVSYPKSGRTWVRFALLKMGAPETIHYHHDGFEFNDGSKPELNFDVEKRLSAYGNIDCIIYLERDPRDVMCSLYHQVTGRFQDYFKYDGTISDFLRDPYFGASNLLGFRQMWAEIVERRNLLKVTYEDMTAQPEAVLQAISDYYQIPADPQNIQNAIEEASFDKMKSVEQSNSFKEPWLRPRNGHPKVRSGKVKGYLGELSDEDIAYLNRVFDLT